MNDPKENTDRATTTLLITIFLAMQFGSSFGQDSKILIEDDFSSLINQWKEVKLDGASKGTFTFTDHK